MKLKIALKTLLVSTALIATTLATILAIFLAAHALPTTARAETPNLCIAATEKIGQVLGTPDKPFLELSQAQRLHFVLNKLKKSDRESIYQAMAAKNMSQIARAIRDNDIENVPSGIRDALTNNPSLSVFFQDLAEFGDAFPDIFALKMADITIMKVLDSIQKKEIQSTIANPDILKSQAMAARLGRTIDDLMSVIVRQGNQESQGFYTEQSGRLPGLRRWMFPLYNRMTYVMRTFQFFQKQLQRYRGVDSLIIEEGLAQAIPLKLTEADVAELSGLVLDSPAEIEEIEKIFKEMVGPQFKINSQFQLGSLDLYGLYKRAKKLNLSSLMNSYDDSTVGALEKMDEVLSRARERLRQDGRRVKDYKASELRLYSEAFGRGMDRNEAEWDGFVNMGSNERYHVERQRTRQVPDGKDSKGNQQYRTEVYYVDDTVRPDFEDIIHDHFDTGDRHVYGLDSIRKRAAKMVAIEQPLSLRMEKLEDEMGEIIKNYTNHVMKGTEKPMAYMAKEMAQLEKDIKRIADYRAYSDRQIQEQYDNDNISNFRSRNKEMQDRYENMFKLMRIISEQMRRGDLQLHPVFDLYDFTNWMNPMRQRRNSIYWQRTGIGLSVTAAGVSYFVLPEFQMMVDTWAQSAADFFNQIVNSGNGG